MDEILDADSTIKYQLDKNTLTVFSNPAHHGFWGLRLAKGALPDRYRGWYTKRDQAIKAAKAYTEERKKD